MSAEKDNRPAAIRARDDVLSLVSHDLRSPLMGIVLATETLLRTIEGEARGHERTQLERIRRSAQEMRRLIDDLVDAADLDAGRLTLTSDVLDVRRMFDDLAARFAGAAVDRGVTLAFEAPNDSLEVRCDRGRAMQVLSTLIGNAIEFTPLGGTVAVTARSVEKHAQLAVADTGPAIAAEDAARIFEPSWPADANRRKGRGIGLHIAARLVEAHGARLQVESPPGGGTTFSFTLPLASDPA
jgi:signal transduction histidine kinase